MISIDNWYSTVNLETATDFQGKSASAEAGLQQPFKRLEAPAELLSAVSESNTQTVSQRQTSMWEQGFLTYPQAHKVQLLTPDTACPDLLSLLQHSP